MCGVPCSVRRTTAPPATGVGVAALAGAGSRPVTTTPARVSKAPNVHLRLTNRVMASPSTHGFVAHRCWSAAFRYHDSLARRGCYSLGDEWILRPAQLPGTCGLREVPWPLF